MVLRDSSAVDVRHFEGEQRSVQTHLLIERLRGELRSFSRDDLGGIAHNGAVRARLGHHASVVHGADLVHRRQVANARSA